MSSHRQGKTAGASLDHYLKLRACVEARLSQLLPGNVSADALQRALRYSLLAPAKRVRAVLMMITARELGGSEEKALDLSSSLEMIHAASLILDDLPAMDDAETRRGMPASHRVFGEATAILAAIGLLNRAYGVAAAAEGLTMDQRIAAIEVLHWAVGLDGLVRGQQDDLADARATMTAGELEKMYARKTGALFAAAAECGAIVAGKPLLRAAMRAFGLDLGVGFQMLDDVLDARATSERAGKDVDQDSGRTTFASLVGVNAAAALARAKIDGALEAARAAARSAGGDGGMFSAFAARLAGTFSDLMPEFSVALAVNG
ncbi:MAG TPA: polyprenyl synthetase family protein [Hyphomicrobiales bacterium]|nr:polyprenyl synthetase family protein [Hyphomicrobiales bacterium]